MNTSRGNNVDIRNVRVFRDILTDESKKISTASFYIEFLKKQGITCFYHFTERKNIASIKKEGGLLSWRAMHQKGIESANRPDPLSRQLDMNKNIADYVKLSFVSSHPMRFIEPNKGKDIVVLQISLDVLHAPDLLFSDKNATDSIANISRKFTFLTKLQYSVFQKNYGNLDYLDKKLYQAEVMVREKISLHHIINFQMIENAIVVEGKPTTPTRFTAPSTKEEMDFSQYATKILQDIMRMRI